MIRAIRKAYGGGFRAGMAEQPYYRHGGTRGTLRLSPPLNPYSNPFNPRWRPIMALAWDIGAQDGLARRLSQWIIQRQKERALQCAK